MEIDIIAKTKDQIIFCEVKTRADNIFGNPEEFVTKQKQMNIMRAADHYLRKNDIPLEARFDIIAIISNKEKFTLNHIPSAFSPRW